MLRDQRKGPEKRGTGMKGRREKWTKSSKEKQGGQEDRDMQEGTGNHHMLCRHVARLAVLFRRVHELLDL